jgi:hypothetical protein
MAFQREHGTCCIILPLKLGVGLIAMYTFTMSLLCILALFSGDIRLQANGYNQTFYYLPSIVGTLGLVFGFVGLLGVFDDKFSWVKAFTYFLFFKLACMTATMVADYFTLQQCDNWLKNPAHTEAFNPQMYALAAQGVCPWALWAYVIGCSVDFGINLYLTYCCWAYYRQLFYNPGYEIDFGNEKYDAEARWRLYQVPNPYADYVPLKGRAPIQDAEEPTNDNEAGYGAAA